MSPPRPDPREQRLRSAAAIAGSRGNLTRIIGPAPTTGGTRPTALMQNDAKDNLTQAYAPSGVSSSATTSCSTDFSASGMLNTAHRTDREYDATQTRLLAVTQRYADPDLGAKTAVSKLEYGDAANLGAVTRAIPPAGNTGSSPDHTFASTYTYGGTGSQAGMLASATDALGNKGTYSYDAVGRRTQRVDARGHVTGANPATTPGTTSTTRRIGRGSSRARPRWSSPG